MSTHIISFSLRNKKNVDIFGLKKKTYQELWQSENNFKADGYTFREDISKLFCVFWKGVYSKRKEFAPKGSKFFPFRIDPSQIGTLR